MQSVGSAEILYERVTPDSSVSNSFARLHRESLLLHGSEVAMQNVGPSEGLNMDLQEFDDALVSSSTKWRQEELLRLNGQLRECCA